MQQEKPKIYLAGPDVFLANARLVGARKQALCTEFGFGGLFPLDNDEDVGADPAKIFRANCALMDRADKGLFNLSPFRGPSADAGTVFELGYMFSAKKPVFGYTNATGLYRERVAADHTVVVDRDGQPRDRDGLAVENFGLRDNLMIARAIEDSGGVMVAVAEQGAGRDGALAAFAAFKACLERMRERVVQSAL
jgi:nucleoside 2-deoxyribosyltransferase